MRLTYHEICQRSSTPWHEKAELFVCGSRNGNITFLLSRSIFFSRTSFNPATKLNGCPFKMADKNDLTHEVTRNKTIEIIKYATLRMTEEWKYNLVIMLLVWKFQQRKPSIRYHSCPLPLRRSVRTWWLFTVLVPVVMPIVTSNSGYTRCGPLLRYTCVKLGVVQGRSLPPKKRR